MRLLRVKVDTREPKLIHTVRGFGYMMREPLHEVHPVSPDRLVRRRF